MCVFILILIETPVFSVDPYKMLRSASSGLGLHCLPRSRVWDTRHEWVNTVLFKKLVGQYLMFCLKGHFLLRFPHILLLELQFCLHF